MPLARREQLPSTSRVLASLNQLTELENVDAGLSASRQRGVLTTVVLDQPHSSGLQLIIDLLGHGAHPPGLKQERHQTWGRFNYNHEHRHFGTGLHTLGSVHHGTASDVRALRQQTLDAARPERFGLRRPEPPKLLTEAWINRSSREALLRSA